MMSRSLLCAAAILAAGPAVAQRSTAADSAAQPAEEAAIKSGSAAAPAEPATSAPPQPGEPQPTPAPTATPTSNPGSAAIDGRAGQIADVVDQEFASYDVNHDGRLDKAEFGAWMVRLKAMSDPSARAGTPRTTAWVNGAFSQADADRNRVLTKSELTGFLSQGRS